MWGGREGEAKIFFLFFAFFGGDIQYGGFEKPWAVSTGLAVVNTVTPVVYRDHI